jgi:cytidyltransferase-like protein
MQYKESFLLPRTKVLVTGTFNICHAGHIELFEFASKFGPVTVGLNTDPYLISKYGDKYVSLKQRAYVVGSCKYVSKVIFFPEETPKELILKLRPEFYIKGPDYKDKDLVEMESIEKIGTKLIIHPGEKINSSSKLLSDLVLPSRRIV